MGSEGVRLGKLSLLLCTLRGGPREGPPWHTPPRLAERMGSGEVAEAAVRFGTAKQEVRLGHGIVQDLSAADLPKLIVKREE